MKQYRMLSFTKVNQKYPSKKEVDLRINEFKEIYKDAKKEDFQQQASRCSQCGIPFCQIGCPLNNNIPDWLYLTAKDRVSEAYQLAAKTNTFPEICGRICPQEKLCEGACVIEKSGHKAVTIGVIESYITEEAFNNNEVKEIPISKNNGKKIAIVGSGPCGLATAVDLRSYGFSVDVYERNRIAGGLMSYGIPSFKLEKDVVLRRLDWIMRAGIRLITNCNVGFDISYQQLSLDYHAVVLANGVYLPSELALQKPDMGVMNSLDFLIDQNQSEYSSFIDYANFNKTFTKSSKLKPDDNITSAKTLPFVKSTQKLLGLDVVVIGAGDTAMDCIRTAIRKGAKSVTCVYRKDIDSMPGSRPEYTNALEEGCEFIFLASPNKYIFDRSLDQSKLKSIRFEKMRLSSIERQGGRELRSLGKFIDIKCDLAIEALGFSAEKIDIDKAISKNSQKANDGKLEENILPSLNMGKSDYQIKGTNFYVGGDLARGGSLVVYAIKDGKSIAKNINDKLKKNEI